MNTSIQKFCDQAITEFHTISDERKTLLEKISIYITDCLSHHNQTNLVYICTHNSRRSHFGQIWAAVAASYYQIKGINTFSGGTEKTAFNINAINALKKIGFIIKATTTTDNPVYEVYFDEQKKPIRCFSKLYNDENNPQTNFAAIMTCSDADDNCPFIPGTDLRIACKYEDPKKYDHTPQQDSAYLDRAKQIATESLYVFFKVKEKMESKLQK